MVAYNPSAPKNMSSRFSPVSKASRSPSVRMSTGPALSRSSSRSGNDISHPPPPSNRHGDFYRPSPSSSQTVRSRQTASSIRRNEGYKEDLRRPSDASRSRRRSESSTTHHVNGHENRNSVSNGNSRTPAQQLDSRAPASPVVIKLEDTTDEMEVDEGPVKVERPVSPQEEFTIRGEGGPATVEIDNLDPETTAEDVKVSLPVHVPNDEQHPY